jgi:lipoprotein-releasing system ATP-binding protein
MKPLIQASTLSRTFKMGDASVQVLSGVNLAIHEGEFLAIEGRSGSGKSTLLHIMGLLDRPDDGDVTYEGQSLFALPAGQRARIRNQTFGFVFQFYHLLPELSVLENTQLAAMVKHSWLGYRASKRKLVDRAKSILDTLGMGHRLTHRPSQLSGGERQRVAIARALMNQPRVLFADEPTGNLDFATSQQIMDVLNTLHREQKQTILMVTHDRTIAKQADRTMVLDRGQLKNAN